VESDDYGPLARARFQLAAGERVALVCRWDSARAAGARLEDSQRWLEDTQESWLTWVHKDEATGTRQWAHPWSEEVIRCELVLKLMIYAPTGAIVAAPTTSLPETPGGVRNWDYRYAWIRDAALSAQGLYAMGHAREAKSFINWAERVARGVGDSGREMHIMYSVRGESDLTELKLEHLEGYRGSRPVQVGNAAAQQLQLDIYGELISAAYEVARAGDNLEPDIWTFLPWVADQACRIWQEPDYGIWEVRSGPAHFVYSKSMVWMALDRAVQLASMGLIQGDAARWQRVSRDIRRQVLEDGYDSELGAFTQVFGSRELDASNLLIPMMELLPVDDPRVQGTINRTLEQLTVNDLVYRYLADDGLPGKEGTFCLCTFWLVDVLALSGRLDEANRILEGMVSRANHLGLYAEQIDPASGEFLGNFPQTFTHVGLINSAIYLAYAEGRPLPFAYPIGSKEHRARADQRI
jgi:GH15 family glucan-1,4-alpha-glucosidase